MPKLPVDPSLAKIREAADKFGIRQLWLVGGAVRDQLLGLETTPDFDLAIGGSAQDFAAYLYKTGVSSITPVTYPQFGTAMVRVDQLQIELAQLRKESYRSKSRKPIVEPATLEEDAARRDITINALYLDLWTGEVVDPTGHGLADMASRILRTPREPSVTFNEDPLRMMRVIRFRWQFGLTPVERLYESIKDCSARLSIISLERIRDELCKMMVGPAPDKALEDLRQLGLLAQFAPEFLDMLDVEQGSFHHLDVWYHTLAAVRLTEPDLVLRLAALFHDIGKPPTRTVEDTGRTRFFGHEVVGAKMTAQVMRRLKFANDTIDEVCLLVRNHMRLGSSPNLTKPALRRLMRDLGDELPRLFSLVEADSKACKPGLPLVDVNTIRERVKEITLTTPAAKLQSPLDGEEIMRLTGLPQGQKVGEIKRRLEEAVLDGDLGPDDTEAARALVKKWAQNR
ncbi:MAG: HD domain-containing protein [Armatimonadetes bacterium]|nr:HD domain-containing protein [Armatimonadota bacterium]